MMEDVGKEKGHKKPSYEEAAKPINDASVALKYMTPEGSSDLVVGVDDRVWESCLETFKDVD